MTSPETFWQETSKKRGAEIGFRTYAVYLGRAPGALLEKAGLFYEAGDILWFEDLEWHGGLLGFLGPRTLYVKTELALPKARVRSVRIVGRGAALTCIRGKADPPAPPVGRFWRGLFPRRAVEIGLGQGDTHYFEVVEEKGLLAALAGVLPE